MTEAETVGQSYLAAVGITPRRANEAEWPLETRFAVIRDADAGFEGAGFLRAHGMIRQTGCYPADADGLETVARLGADHVTRAEPAHVRVKAWDGWREGNHPGPGVQRRLSPTRGVTIPCSIAAVILAIAP